MGQERHAFLSSEWFAVLAELVEDVVATNPDESTSFTFSEQYVDVPDELGPGPVGWHVVIRGRVASFDATPRADADLLIVADYAFALETMAEIDPSDPEDRRRRRQQLADAHRCGLIRIVGDPTAPDLLAPLHDLIASRTQSPNGSAA